MAERFYSQEEVRVLLSRIGHTTLWHMEKKGLIKSVMIGSKPKYPESEVDACQQRIKAGEARVLSTKRRKANDP